MLGFPQRGKPRALHFPANELLGVPRTLTHDGQGHILQNPTAELDALRGAPVAVKDGAVQAVFSCFDLHSRPRGDFALTLNGGLTLAYTEADRTAYLTFTAPAMAAGRTGRCAHGRVTDATCKIFLHGTRIFPHMTFFHARKAYFLGFLPKKRFFMKKPLILRTIFSIINSVITTGIVCP